MRQIDPLRFDGNNGYRVYYSPCQNGLSCYQQLADTKVMSVLDNSETGTCDRYLAFWEEGLHQPSYSPLDGGIFEFVYYNGQPCEDGASGSEERIIYICDESVATAETINVTLVSECRIDYYIASSLACDTSF